MIRIEKVEGALYVDVFGEFTDADFREFEQHAMYEIRFHGPLNLLVAMLSYTLDVLWDEIRFLRAHRQEFSHVAVVSSSEFQTWSTWLSRLYTGAEFAVFSERAEAQAWLLAVRETGVASC